MRVNPSYIAVRIKYHNVTVYNPSHTCAVLARTEPFFMGQRFAHLRRTDFDFEILTSYPVIKPLQEVTHVFPSDCNGVLDKQIDLEQKLLSHISRRK